MRNIAIKFLFPVALLMVAATSFYGWSMYNRTHLRFTIKGIDEFGLHLELPYGKESPGDIVLTNKGMHSLLAYKVRWEGVKHNGEVVERKLVKYYPTALLEKNPAKRAEMLKGTPLVPPQTKWLIGLNRETKQINNQIPRLDEIGRDPRVFPDLQEYRQINITLVAILDNGQFVGTQAKEFKNEVSATVTDYLNRLKREQNGETSSK